MKISESSGTFDTRKAAISADVMTEAGRGIGHAPRRIDIFPILTPLKNVVVYVV